jgi:hypothetical protein
LNAKFSDWSQNANFSCAKIEIHKKSGGKGNSRMPIFPAQKLKFARKVAEKEILKNFEKTGTL